MHAFASVGALEESGDLVPLELHPRSEIALGRSVDTIEDRLVRLARAMSERCGEHTCGLDGGYALAGEPIDQSHLECFGSPHRAAG